MMKAVEWEPLICRGIWRIDRQTETAQIRLSLGETVMYFDRDAYQMLWGLLSEGLDTLERIEDQELQQQAAKDGVIPCLPYQYALH